MESFLFAILYIAVIGIISNPLAALIPRRFSADAFPFSSYAFEKQGRIYEKIGIKKWKDIVPDMSKVLKTLMPKKITTQSSLQFEALVQETCVAELVHTVLLILSFGILFFWHNGYAWLFLAVYNIFGNLLFIVIQRYNRPRLERLAKKAKNNHG